MTLSSSSSDLNDRAGSLCVLFLEDDAFLRDKVLAPKLRQFGFEVLTAGRATEMYEVLSRRVPDIILLDVGLPDSNGFDVAQNLREEHAGIGVVMLTGRSGSADLVRGLSEGADAYLSKPVDIDVLIATLHSIARRLSPTMHSGAGTWRLSHDKCFLLSPRDDKLALSKAERRLLEVVMGRPNEVILRETLIGSLTENVSAYDPHRLESLVHRLRRRVIATAGEPLPLKARHGAGYMFVI